MKEQITVILGRNSKENTYCILTTDFPWKWLTENLKYLYSVKFEHHQTNWGGMDNADRIYKILKENHLDIGEFKITLPQPIFFCGEDYDMGHIDKWECRVDTLIEVKKNVQIR